MNELEKRLDYPLGEALPGPAQRLEVAPGVFWIRMPLPFQLDHINLWLLRDDFDGEGWTLIDCGIASTRTRELWEQVFATALDGLPLRRILCTHNHPDHVGLAAWLQERFGAPLWMTVGEYAMARVLSAGLPGVEGEAAVQHFIRHGVADQAMLDEFRARKVRHYASLVPAVPASFRRIQDRERLRIGTREFEVIVGFGHSVEHAALYSADDGLLISGDMVLPRISTNVSVFEIEPESNPVSAFLGSLQRFAVCRDTTLVLPSHGRPFRGLHERIRQLSEHHAERLEAVLVACRERPQSAADIIPVMFGRRFDAHQTGFALGESLAHLHALWYDGRVRRELDGEGVVRFAA